jgi:hypothetical protein
MLSLAVAVLVLKLLVLKSRLFTMVQMMGELVTRPNR